MNCPKCKGNDFYSNGRCKPCAREASKRSREKRLAKEQGGEIYEAAQKAEEVLKIKQDAKLVLDLNYRNPDPMLSGKAYYWGKIPESKLVECITNFIESKHPDAERAHIDSNNWDNEPFYVGKCLVISGTTAPKSILIGKVINES